MNLLIAILFICYKTPNVSAGDCDHLKPYPVYSEHQNINLTSWNKPWVPEIDWLNSYVNLSSYPHSTLDGLFTAYTLTTYSKYYYGTRTGCFVQFPIDYKLTYAYYSKHYKNTNESLYLCIPSFPANREVLKEYIKQFNPIICFYYVREILESAFRGGEWSFIWSTYGGTALITALLAAALITLTGLFGNILILRVIFVYKELQTPTNLFLASLAVSDLLITLFLPIYAVYVRYFLFSVRLTVHVCTLLNIMRTTLYVSSVYHLTAVSFERFFAICYPMKVRSICTKRRAKIVILVLWLISTAYGLPYVFTQVESESFAGHYCHLAEEYLVSYWYAVQTGANLFLIFLIPFSLILHNYARIGWTLFKSLKESVHLKEGIKKQDNKSNDDEEKIVKVVKMLVVVMVIFMVCWTPILLLNLSQGISKIFTQVGLTSNNIHTTTLWLKLLSYINSCANAFIYYLTSDQFRRAFKEQIKFWSLSRTGNSLKRKRNQNGNDDRSSSGTLSKSVDFKPSGHS